MSKRRRKQAHQRRAQLARLARLSNSATALQGQSSASPEQRSGLDDLAKLLGKNAPEPRRAPLWEPARPTAEEAEEDSPELLALLQGDAELEQPTAAPSQGSDGPDMEKERQRLTFKVQAERLRKLVGERLKTARNLSEMSQVEAARAIGYTTGVHVHHAEAGKRLPGLEKLVLLARLYGVSLDYLLGATEDPTEDRDEELQRRIADAVTGRMVMLARAIYTTNIKAVREMGLDTAETLQMAEQAVEIELALGKLRQLNPHLDEEAKGLATLVMKAQAHADAGRRALERHKRAHRMAAARVREADQEAFDALGGDCAASLLATADPDVLRALLKG